MTCERCNANLRDTNQGAGLCDPCQRAGKREGARTLLQAMLAGGVRGEASCADPKYGDMGWKIDAMWFPEYGPAQRKRSDYYATEYGITHIDAGSEMAMSGTEICFTCPIQEACLRSSFQEATRKGDHTGIRGGVSQRARRRFYPMARHNLDEAVRSLLRHAKHEAEMLGLLPEEDVA